MIVVEKRWFSKARSLNSGTGGGTEMYMRVRFNEKSSIRVINGFTTGTF